MHVPQEELSPAYIRPSSRHVDARAAGNRIAAAAITIAAHVAVILALLVGLHTARAVYQPPEITVHITEDKPQKPRAPQLEQPVLATPVAVHVPMPDVEIAPAPSPVIATAIPMPSVPPPNPAPPTSNAVPTWQGLVLARLEQAKRYPPTALAHRQQGVASLRFTMDREGRVLTAAIEKSAGFAALDAETLALIQRAQPLPKPPPEIPGATITLLVPIEFFLNGRR